jgi:hypothetical protein
MSTPLDPSNVPPDQSTSSPAPSAPSSGGLLGSVSALLGGVLSGSAITGPDGLLPSGILGATP